MSDMARASEVSHLRKLGLSLAEIAEVLRGDPSDLDGRLAIHEADLKERARQLADTMGKVRRLRSELLEGRRPRSTDLADICRDRLQISVAFDLPWPWGGEPFELADVGPLNFITGPLGSGKTRLAMRLAESLPGARFVGLDRLAEDSAAAQAQLDDDAALRARVEQALSWMLSEGAERSLALTALLVGLHPLEPRSLVVDMVEEGLGEATQMALMSYMRVRPRRERSLFLMTRSSSILDMSSADAGETIIYCPANHSPPMCVVPIAGTAGFEAVSSCLGMPDVRARTAGVIAWRPQNETAP